ncbi:MAG: ThuA domain-containing protein [Saprospiraceae bacterium]|nr:ThuA domain-containing protein [Saprospiraceae bacterium]
MIRYFSPAWKGLLFAAAFTALFVSCNKRPGAPAVLVFCKTAGYHHESIADGIVAIQKLGQENGFTVDTTTNSAWFRDDTLSKYSAVVFLSTTGDVLDHYQEASFERYIQAGGGYAGIHAASDTEYEWGWYGRLAGAYFLEHPGMSDTFNNVQEGVLHVADQKHEATKHLPAQWKRTDEWYSFKKMNPEVKVLMTIDEKTYKGGKNGDYHPMSWYHYYDGGRAFYTALGHTKESFTEPDFLKLLLGGIQFAIGDNKQLDYSKARTLPVPEENRFSKTMLSSGLFYEPTEMAILPNLDILVAQRRGEILLYKNETGTVKQVGFFDAYFKATVSGVNAEEGVMGIQADPNFAKNHYVYVFYSPADTSVNRLSRFKFENDTLDLRTEQIILQFYSQRNICCHTGGSIAFDKDGLLYLSTGDNSTPFDEPDNPYANHGYAPLDDRPGHEQYDARRSSGNANDLRGKILRIRVKEDGSYDIPEGNLYPKGQAGTRPEIYVQGNRNPYRISIDQKNGYLYWGEVGPDANNDSLDVRGPRGYDEVNQARKAGFFGWPFFIGDNYPYRLHDYGTGASGPAFDPQKPVNNSKNNTGLQELPPAQPAFIWYPYAVSPDFPQTGTGGRNAMAGPVYYADMFPESTRLPAYYNNKLIIYDWIRGWIKAVTLQPNGDFDKMEPFMPNTKFNSIIDMEIGPDGQLYLLEYGTGWFTKNLDSGLSRIDFNAGNRAPQVNSITADKTSGSLPLSVVFTVDAVDLEYDKLSYTWNIGTDIKKETSEPRLEHTFDKVGDYTISVQVSDDKNATTKSSSIGVYAGNEAPVVNIDIMGNETFYFPGKPVRYAVSIADKDDPAAASDAARALVYADYLDSPDKAALPVGHLVAGTTMPGKSIMEAMVCKACHKIAEKSIGPSFEDIAKRYQKDKNAPTYLLGKILKGGAGVWGETAMPGNPDLKEVDAKQIVAWIQSLAPADQAKKSLPAVGSVPPTLGKKPNNNGVFILSASYTDKGGKGIQPLSGMASHTLRNNTMGFDNARNIVNYTSFDYGGYHLMMTPKSAGSFSLDSLDLTGISAATLAMGWQVAPQFGYTFELRLDGPNGKKLGEAVLKGSGSSAPPKVPFQIATLTIPIASVTDGKRHNLYLVSKPNDPGEPNQAALQGITFIAK